jgi:hypothetical protein
MLKPLYKKGGYFHNGIRFNFCDQFNVTSSKETGFVKTFVYENSTN